MCKCYKREMLEDIKFEDEYFDEDFGNYVEDVDLAWRAQLKGWKCVYEPNAVAYHVRGVTRAQDKKVTAGYYAIGYRNRYLTMFKNMTHQELRRNFSKFILKETVFLLTKKPGTCSRKVVLGALIESLKQRIRFRPKRTSIQSDLRVTEDYMADFFGYKTLSFFRYFLHLFLEFLWRTTSKPVLFCFHVTKRILHKVYKIAKTVRLN